MLYAESGSSACMPDPYDVARRVAFNTSNPRLNPDLPSDPDEVRQVFFSLADNRNASEAEIKITHCSQSTRAISGQVLPVASTYARGKIGHYDPAGRTWRFYPEAIHPDEEAALGQEFEQQAELSSAMLAIDAENGWPFNDVRHELTTRARRELSDLLSGTGIVQRLIEDDPTDRYGNMREVDDVLSCTLTMTPGSSFIAPPESAFPKPESVLWAMYEGVRLRCQDGAVVRGRHEVPVAFRTSRYPDVWKPNPEHLSSDEWEQLDAAPRLLQGYKRELANFSLARCLVSYNILD